MNIETFLKSVVAKINEQAEQRDNDPIEIFLNQVEISCEICPLRSLCHSDPTDRDCHDFLKDHLAK